MLSYSERKSFARVGAGQLNAHIAAAVASVKAQEAADMAANIAAYKKRHAPVPFTSEALNAATHVRTTNGWHAVARVNAKSVTVHTAYSRKGRSFIAVI